MTGAARVAGIWGGLSPNARGAWLVVASGVLFTLVSVFVKLLGQSLHSFEIAFFRALFGLLWVLPAVAWHGVGVLRTKRPLGHVMRGAFGMGVMFCSFYAAIHLPLAEVTAYGFTKPFFVALLAVLFLGEACPPRRLAAIAVGFGGMLLLLRPDVTANPAILVALLAAVFMALVVVMVSKLGRSEHPVAVMFYFGLVSTAIAAVPALLVWRQPTGEELALLALMGGCGALAQSLMLRAFSIGEATVLVNFEYLQLLHAILFGIVVFGDIPGLATLAGSAVIILTAAYVARREGRRAAPVTPAAGAVALQPSRAD